MSDEVKIRITIEDNGSSAMKTIGVNAGDLQNAVKQVKTDIEDLNTSVVNFAQTSQAASVSLDLHHLCCHFSDHGFSMLLQSVVASLLQKVPCLDLPRPICPMATASNQ